MTVNNILKAARVEQGYTIYRLAKLCGLAEDQISKIERGMIKNPQFRTVAKIAEVLNLSLDEIYKATKEDIK